jgi:predicted RNase H-like HicB family nuclease
MIYPVLIHKEPRSDYGVSVPDLPGCITVGRTVDEALAMAKEAIELHLEGLIEAGHAVPKPRAVQDHQRCAEHRGGVWALVAVDHTSLRTRVRRVNVTIPERVLDAIDRAAAVEHDTRSGLLTKAAGAYLRKNLRATQPRSAKPWKP